MPTSNPLRSGVVAALLVLAVFSPASTTVAAAGPGDTPADDVLDGVVAADNNSSFGLSTAQQAIESSLAFASGIVNRALSLGGPDVDAATACSDLKSRFNQDASTIQSYVNNRTNASTDANVLEITCSIDGNAATVFAVADVNNSNYENASMVSSTSRTVDENCTLESDAAARADDELDHFVSEYVTAGEEIPRTETKRVAARYGGMVSCSFMG